MSTNNGDVNMSGTRQGANSNNTNNDVSRRGGRAGAGRGSGRSNRQNPGSRRQQDRGRNRARGTFRGRGGRALALPGHRHDNSSSGSTNIAAELRLAEVELGLGAALMSLASSVLDPERNSLIENPTTEQFAPWTIRSLVFETCGNCGQEGHVLLQCVWPSVDGYVHGCPWCNTNEHEGLECPEERLFTHETLVDLTRARANRPPLACFPRQWTFIATLTEQHNRGEYLGIKMPSTFPWSQMYARALVGLEHYTWETVDYSQLDYASNLPADPRTNTPANVAANMTILQSQSGVVTKAPLIKRGMTAEQMDRALSTQRTRVEMAQTQQAPAAAQASQSGASAQESANIQEDEDKDLLADCANALEDEDESLLTGADYISDQEQV